VTAQPVAVEQMQELLVLSFSSFEDDKCAKQVLQSEDQWDQEWAA
jgi:hypothetical protein